MSIYGELEDINKIFFQYNGAKYTIQYFTISLGKLIILIESEESDKVVYLASVATKYMKGNFRQKNIQLEASKDTIDGVNFYKIIDKNSDFELVSEGGGFAVAIGYPHEFSSDMNNLTNSVYSEQDP